MARWQNGYAAACKAVYAGSIPTLASNTHVPSPGGGIGRRNGLKIRRPQGHAGSIPARGTNFRPHLMLSVQGLHLWRGDRHVLRGVSFSLEPGRCALLTGRNGAGKTTLLRAIAGLLEPEEGQVSWRGVPARANSTRR